MPVDTYTTFLQEPEPKDREQSMESYLKARLQSLDRAVAGYTSVSLAGLSGNVDLSPTQAKHRRIKLTGNPSAAVTVRIPHATGANADTHFVNACGGSFSTVTVKSTGANAGNAAGVTLPAGFGQYVTHDGESAYAAGQIVGATGQVVCARVYNSAAQSIANASLSFLAFNSQRFVSPSSMHDTVTNNSRLTSRLPGLYDIFAAVNWASNGVGFRQAALIINGATYIAIDNKGAVSGDSTKHALSTVYPLAVGDYAQVQVYQNSGGALNVDNTQAFSCEFGMARIGG